MSIYYRLRWDDELQAYQVVVRSTGQVTGVYPTAQKAGAVIRSLEYDMDNPS